MQKCREHDIYKTSTQSCNDWSGLFNQSKWRDSLLFIFLYVNFLNALAFVGNKELENTIASKYIENRFANYVFYQLYYMV